MLRVRPEVCIFSLWTFYKSLKKKGGCGGGKVAC